MLHDLFTYADTAEHTLTEADEAEAISAAREGSDEATWALLLAYGPALRSAVSRFKGNLRDGQTSQAHGEDGTTSSALADLQSAAVVAFLELIAEHDPALNPRLAGRVSARLSRALADEVAASASFAVPERTLSRFYGIVRDADGDLALALESAPDYGMTRETFSAVLHAVKADSLDGLTADDEDGARPEIHASSVFSPSPIVDVEDKILVEVAFGAVDDEEARIVELAYGFTEYDPVPDAEIGHRIGLTRPTVQRKRGKALGKMRKALAVTPGEDVR